MYDWPINSRVIFVGLIAVMSTGSQLFAFGPASAASQTSQPSALSSCAGPSLHVASVGAAQITMDDGLGIVFANTTHTACQVINPRAVELSAPSIPVRFATYSSAQQGKPLATLAPGQHAVFEIVACYACSHPRFGAVAHYTTVKIAIGATSVQLSHMTAGGYDRPISILDNSPETFMKRFSA